MILGRVVGSVWATRKHERLSRYKLLIIRPYGYYNPSLDAQQVIAVDTLDAGVGDDVVVCIGTPARESLGDENLPVDAVVMAIVDQCQLMRDGASPPKSIGGQAPKKVNWL